MAAVVREAVEICLGRSSPRALPIGDDPADAMLAAVGGTARDESTNRG